MIKEFKKVDLSKKIHFKVFDPRGQVESGMGIGVSRDIYSGFWREILDSLFIGDRQRIPYIRHDLYIDDWEAIGNILLKGYLDTGYFPVQICTAFVFSEMYQMMYS